MSELVFKEESYRIVGACMEVYNELGCGFLEAVYQEALAIEFELRGIPCEQEKSLSLEYKGRPLAIRYRADFVCYDSIIVETKAVDELTTKSTSQIINYLNATKTKLGLLVNFGATDGLQYKRYVI